MDKALSYQEILLVPKYSELESRSLANTSVKLCGWEFKLPIIPANMEDVIDMPLAKWFSENGYFYIYHRFGEKHNCTLNFLRDSNKENWKLISISIGVNKIDRNLIEAILWERHRVDFITIDVAHGHHLKVREMIKYVKEKLPNTKIIAGNIATFEAAQDLEKWGADVIKVGIGQGSICTTRFQTGFSVPMFTCLKSIMEAGKPTFIPAGSSWVFLIDELIKIPIIADGGIQNIGDISKALVAGATMVMSGGLFAPCINSPAKIIDNKKQYRGSTSFAAKKQNKHIEGRIVNLEADITIKEKLEEIKQALQSSISYAGGKDLSSFQNVKWISI